MLRRMPATLFVVHGSHPCATVQRALELKGIEHRLAELPPAAHAPVVKLLFGRRTVPALRLEDGERLSGSRTILRRLDELVAEPALVPADPARRAQVLEAEEWGDDVLQPVARRVLWCALDRAPTAIPTFQEHSALPMPAASWSFALSTLCCVNKTLPRKECPGKTYWTTCGATSCCRFPPYSS